MRVAQSAMIDVAVDDLAPFSSTTMTRSASPSSATPMRRAATLDLVVHVLGVQRAGVAVDVPAVGPTPDRDDLGPELGEHRRRHAVGGPVRGIDDHAHAVEGAVRRKGVLAVDDVAPGRVIDALGLADAVAGGILAIERRCSRAGARSRSLSRRAA